MDDAVVRMSVTWCVPASEARSIAAALQGVMLRTRGEPGCAGCSISTELGEPVVIDYRETWDDEASLRRQIRSDRFSTLVELIERATARPVIEFTVPGGARGLDYARDVRAHLHGI